MNNLKNKINFEYITLGVLIICGFWIRFSGAIAYSFHTDELIHSFIAHGSNLIDVFNRGLNETHPPLGHFIRHFVFFINDDILASRITLIIFNLVTILFAYLIGKKISPNSYYSLFMAAMVSFSNLAVIYSVSIRNYSFFTLFAVVAYYYFVCYQKTEEKKDFWLYIVFSFLACFTHSSAFVFTFILSLSLILNLLSKKKYKQIIRFAAAHLLHLAALVFLYYFYYIKTDIGSGWYYFYLNTEAFKVLREANTLGSLFAVFYGFYVCSKDFLNDPNNAYFLVAALIASLYGCISLWRINIVASLSIIIAFITAIILAKLHIYPMTGSRYGTYLFIFTALPLAKFFVDIFSWKDINKNLVLILITVFSILFSNYAVKNDIYFANSGEFPNTKKSFASGVDYITNNTLKNDVIITNKGSWLHFLYLKAPDNSGYFPKSFGEMDFEGRKLYFQEKRNFWEYILKDNFYDFLTMLDGKVSTKSNIWFVVFGTSDYSIMTLYDCDYIKPYIADSYSDKGILIFKLNHKFFEKNFFPPNKDIDSCFTKSKIPHFG